MFGCQKPEACLSDLAPAADVAAKGVDTAPTPNHGLAMGITGEGSNIGQLLTDSRHLSLYEGESLNSNGQPSSARPWSMSVPALRSSISFANALPPIPSEVASRQQLASTNDVSKPESEQHSLPQPQGREIAGAADHMGYTAIPAVDASVSDWLSQQVVGELQPSFGGSGDSMVEVATAGAEQGEASASSGANNAEAMGMQVRSTWLDLSSSKGEVCHMPISYRAQSGFTFWGPIDGQQTDLRKVQVLISVILSRSVQPRLHVQYIV